MGGHAAGRERMSEAAAPGWMVDRLRGNLRAEGIPLAAPDLDRILELGLLRTALAFEALDPEIPHTRLPDHLAGWGDPPPAPRVAPAPAGRSAIPAGGGPQDSIAGMAGRLRSRAVSPVALADRALETIAARDPELNAFQLVLGERTRERARAAEREIAAGHYRGPLHGIPIAIKDLLDLAGTPTTAGSRLLAGSVSGTSAAAVERLEAAGAVIVGKTRLAEFAYSPGSNNAHYGPTHNPHDPTRDTGGSSSGSGAAVAAGMVVAALGSDTGGSIRIPASLCGIVGLKPTFGRVSLHGAVPLSWSLDHLGPMTRTVADAALMLEALAGIDPRDPRTCSVPPPAGVDGLEAGVRGLRIGVLGDDGEAEPLGTPEALDAWRAGLAALTGAGATLVAIDLPELARSRIINYALLAMEAAVHHRPWLRERSADYGEFARLRLLSAHAYLPGAYVRAQQARAELRATMDALFTRVDLLSTPTMPDGAPPLGVPAPTRFTAPFNLLGWPAISVPVGRTEGRLPLGSQLVGGPWDEATVLRAARTVEMATVPAG
jgi:aspartyl-tRNA(Asn)/glutamyl-tRNA(Gln) amidotransferase subunit A